MTDERGVFELVLGLSTEDRCCAVCVTTASLYTVALLKDNMHVVGVDKAYSDLNVYSSVRMRIHQSIQRSAKLLC